MTRFIRAQSFSHRDQARYPGTIQRWKDVQVGRLAQEGVDPGRVDIRYSEDPERSFTKVFVFVVDDPE